MFTIATDQLVLNFCALRTNNEVVTCHLSLVTCRLPLAKCKVASGNFIIYAILGQFDNFGNIWRGRGDSLKTTT